MTKQSAKKIIEKNVNREVPLVVSHVDFRVDLTIGRVTKLFVDNTGLFCEGIIDNVAFLNVLSQLNEDFIAYFTEASPGPFLYLKSYLPCFSLSHFNKTFLIRHVALVDLGARRGTLIQYSFNDQSQPKSYSSNENDFFRALNCYSRNALKLSQRNELLFRDALLCGETDTEFINASHDVEKINIRVNKLESKSQNEPEQFSNMDEALSLISTIASVLEERGKKRSRGNDSESVPKRARVEEPVLNASQTLEYVNRPTDVEEEKDEIKDFKRQMLKMQEEFMNSQKTMWTEMMKSQQQWNLHQPNQTNLMQQVQGNTMINPLPQAPGNASYQNGTQMTNLIQTSQQLPTTAQEPTQGTSMQQLAPQSAPAQNIEQIAAEPKRDVPSAEAVLTDAGMHVNKEEKLINELFRLFIEQNFVAKRKY